MIVIPGFFVGVAVFDSFRRVFSDDHRLVLKLLADQPATMGSAATIVGSVLVWAVFTILGIG